MENLIREIEDFESDIDRRKFLKLAVAVLLLPGITVAETAPPAFAQNEREFLEKVALTLIPANLLQQTGIDLMANIEQLLNNGTKEQRAKIARLISVARKSAFIYGGEKIAIRTRTSKFVLVQKMGKALSSLVLVAFWGDERALKLINK